MSSSVRHLKRDYRHQLFRLDRPLSLPLLHSRNSGRGAKFNRSFVLLEFLLCQLFLSTDKTINRRSPGGRGVVVEVCAVLL